MPEPLHILVVEDNPDDALLLQIELESGGFEPRLARVETREELRAALTNPWDVVVSDYRLPQFDGLEALRMVRETDPELPFILVSGAVGEELAVEAMRAGAQDYILKRNLTRLIPTIRRSLNEAEDRRLRRRAEEALKQSELRFRVALANSLVTVFEQDMDLRYTWVHNQKFGTSDNLIGKRDRDFMTPESAARVDAIKQAVIDNGKPARGEVGVEATGTPFHYYDMYVEPRLDRDGRIMGIICTAIDITDRKQAEAALQESEERYQLVSRATNDIIWDWNLDTDQLRWNESVEAAVGRKRTEMRGTSQDWIDHVHKDDRERVMESMHRAIDNGQSSWSAEYRFGPTGGPWRTYLDRGLISRDARGRAHRMIGSMIDLTERKQAEEALRQSEERMRLAQQVARIGTFDWDIATGVMQWSPEIEALYGMKPGEFGGTYESWTSRIHPDDLAEADRHVRESLETGSFEAEWRTAWSDGTVRWLAGRGHVFKDENGRPLRMIGVNMDITERKSNEDELQLAALVYQESAEAMMVTDEDNWIVAVNPSFERITGYAASEVLGRSPIILSSARSERMGYREMISKLTRENYWQGELWLKKKNGEDFAVSMTINTTFHGDGLINRHVTLFNDITQKKQADELVWQQANFDPLTGLPNRRMFLDHLELEIRKSRRSGMPVALMYLDLDGFKYVNDTLGHDTGDLLLRETGSRLSRCVRETDTVARLGGDEFTVILSELQNVRHVEKVARHILHALAEPFQLGNDVARVSGSLGITLYPQDGHSLDDLLINADQAMYAAKEAGKNRYRFFTEDMQKAAQERMWMVSELRNAIPKGQFSLVYQPIVELATGCINKVEALLRWSHPERGMIEPSVFIPVAEETGLIQEIGDWVFFQAARQVAEWRRIYHPDFQISINKSPVQFKAKVDDLAVWFDYLKSLHLPGHAIAVEITEGVLMDESKAVEEQLLAFRDAGIEVALDDFGTGYSTLSYLKRFDIDRLKIDQTFIRDLEDDPNDQALCEAIIVMGHKLGIKVIAEGVETDGQRDLLANAGCDFAQGHLLSSPVSAHELDDLLKKGALSCPNLPPGAADGAPLSH